MSQAEERLAATSTTKPNIWQLLHLMKRLAFDHYFLELIIRHPSYTSNIHQHCSYLSIVSKGICAHPTLISISFAVILARHSLRRPSNYQMAPTYPFIDGRFPNYYSILSVPWTATTQEIVAAYKIKAQEEHPDKHGGTRTSTERFALIANARDVLRDTTSRRDYDRALKLNDPGAFNRPVNTHNDRSTQRARPRSPQRNSHSRPAPNPGQWEHPLYGYSHHSNLQGDKNYVPADFDVAFAAFRPPASCYPFELNGHKGTKPRPGSTWLMNMYGCHEAACSYAMAICRLAKSCEDTTSQITNGLRTSQSGKIEHYEQICAANELVLEILHYAGCSYFATKQVLDHSVEISPNQALPVVKKICVALHQVQALFDKTLSTLISIRNVFTGHWGSTSTVLEFQRSIVVGWDRALVLPANIQYGIIQTFYTPAPQRNNNWLRRRNDDPLAGNCYPLEAFAPNTNPKFHRTRSFKGSRFDKKKEDVQRPGFSGSTDYREPASYESDDDMDVD